jgi:hypothetical protein
VFSIHKSPKTHCLPLPTIWPGPGNCGEDVIWTTSWTALLGNTTRVGDTSNATATQCVSGCGGPPGCTQIPNICSSTMHRSSTAIAGCSARSLLKRPLPSMFSMVAHANKDFLRSQRLNCDTLQSNPCPKHCTYTQCFRYKSEATFW